MHFELWRDGSFNLQGSWKSESEALVGACQILAQPLEPVEGYALVRVARGRRDTFAEGKDLLELAARAGEKADTRRHRRRVAA